MIMILGVDIGGANIKIASPDGSFVFSRYTPLWKDFDALGRTLGETKENIDVDAVGAVMTGELSDYFETKKEGILRIVDVIREIFGEKSYFFGDHGFSKYIDKPMSFSAANWIASSLVIAKEFQDVIFVDIGSTTSDIIPILGGEIVASRTDLERLRKGELVYSGVLRTNVACLLDRITIDNIPHRISSEFFAITADVYLLLGDIRRKDYTCKTPDGRDKDEKSAMRRIARVLCADLSEIGEARVLDIAKQIKEVQISDLIDSIKHMTDEYNISRIISAGSGEFLAENIADRLGMEYNSVSEVHGSGISKVFPAYATAKLLEWRLTR